MSILLDATGPIADAIEDDTGAVEATKAADTTDTTAEPGGMDSLEDAILGDGREAEEAAEEAAEVEAESGQEGGDAEPEAEPQPTPAPASSAATDAVIAHLTAIRDARNRVRKAEWALEDAKEVVKERKAKWEQAVADLGQVIDNGPEELPLFDGSRAAATDEPPSPSLTGIEQAEPAAEESDTETAADPAEDDSWRDVTFEQIDLPSGICTLLREAGMPTIGHLVDWTAKGRLLTDIAKIGPAKADKIKECLDAFWASRNMARPVQFVDLANHEAHEETAEKCFDIINEIYDGEVTDECDEYCHSVTETIAKIRDAIVERKSATLDEVKELEKIKKRLTSFLDEQKAETEPKPAEKPKGIVLDAKSASDDYEEALETCDEIEGLIEEALEQEGLSSDGEEFLTGVSDTLSDMRANIEEKQHATKKQLAALDNMRNGVANWIR